MGRKYSGAVGVSFGSMLLEGGLNNIIVALMGLIAIRFSRSVPEIALLVSAKGLGTILTLYIIGKISDLKGRKIVIMIGAILFLIFIGGMIVTTNYEHAVVYAFIGGLAHGFMDAPGLSILFDVYGKDSGPMMSMTQVFFGGGGVLTTFASSYLILHGIHYDILFKFYFGVGVVVFLLTLFSKFPNPASFEDVKSENLFKNPPEFKKEGLFIVLLLIVFAMTSFIFTTWIPTYIEYAKGIAQSDAVKALTYYLLGTVVGSWVFSIVLRKYHSTTLMQINPLIAAFVVVGLYLAQNLYLIYALVFSLGFLLGNFFPMGINLGGELFPEKAGMMAGIIGTGTMVSGTIMVYFTSLIMEKYSVSYNMYIAVFSLLLLVLLCRAFRKVYLDLGKKVFDL